MELDEGGVYERSRIVSSYELGGALGVGAFGEVRFARCTRTDSEVCVKIIDTSRFRDDSTVSIKNEIEILRQLDPHKSVTKLIDFIEDVSLSGTWCSNCGCTEFVPGETPGHCANCGPHDIQCHTQEETRQVSLIVQEICWGGELFSILEHSGALPENIARYYFLDLVRTLNFCHSKGIVHRDIKPENLLLDEKFQLRVIDFGLSVAVQDHQRGSLLSGSCGSLPYGAPEVYYNKELYRSQSYRGEPVDVWSSAVTLYMMLTGKFPFKRPLHKTFGPHLKKCTQFTAILDGNFSPTFPTLAKDLLRKMFQLNPSHRLSFEEILRHPWCKGPLPSNESLNVVMSDLVENSLNKQRKHWILEKLSTARAVSLSPSKPLLIFESEQKHIDAVISDLHVLGVNGLPESMETM